MALLTIKKCIPVINKINVVTIPHRKLSKKGLTLVEVMLAVGILAFAICSMIFAYALCSMLIATSRNVNIATNAAVGMMEQIRSSTFADIPTDYNELTFTLNSIPSSKGVVYVDDSNPELLTVTVSICWRQGARIIGEDKNLNGILDTGENTIDATNTIIDSPVQLVTRIANR